MKKTHVFATASLLAALVLCGCDNQPQSLPEKIDTLKQRIETDMAALQQVENVTAREVKRDFKACDSALQYADSGVITTAFEKLNLVQAYLSQFAEATPKMRKNIGYTLLQLDRLKADSQNQYISDSLALVYFGDEVRAADTFHHQVAYFEERFKACQTELNTLKKTLK